MEDTAGLICGYLFRPNGEVSAINWAQIHTWQPEQGALWLDLNRLAPETRQWLQGESGLDDITVQALLQEETRPRTVPGADNALVFLRGANFNPGTQPDAMVSILAWLDTYRLISSLNGIEAVCEYAGEKELAARAVASEDHHYERLVVLRLT
jgi:zinc transporter